MPFLPNTPILGNGMLGAAFGGPPSPSGPTLVQQKTATAADGSAGVTATFDTPLTAGNSVLAFMSFNPDVTAPTGALFLVGGGSMEQAAASATSGIDGEVWYVHAITGAETGVTYTLDGSFRGNLMAIEVSGLANSVPTNTSINSGTSSTAVTTGSVNPVAASNIIVAMYASVLNSFVSGPTDGLTALTATGGTGAFQQEGYIIQATATAKNPGWTITADNWAACAAAFAGS